MRIIRKFTSFCDFYNIMFRHSPILPTHKNKTETKENNMLQNEIMPGILSFYIRKISRLLRFQLYRVPFSRHPVPGESKIPDSFEG